MRERSKALIVGAGPTGLVMAHELARDGIQCRLIDKAPRRAMQSRAIAILPRQDLFVGRRRLSGRLTAGAGRRVRGSVGLLGYRRSPLRHRGAGDDVEISLGHGVDLRLRGRSTLGDFRVTRS